MCLCGKTHYVELPEQLLECNLPLMHSCSPFDHVVSHNNFNNDEGLRERQSRVLFSWLDSERSYKSKEDEI